MTREKDITDTLPSVIEWRGPGADEARRLKLYGWDGVRIVGVHQDGTREELLQVFWVNLSMKRVRCNKLKNGKPYVENDEVAWEERTFADVRVMRKV
jgi:hypothetical protein